MADMTMPIWLAITTTGLVVIFILMWLYFWFEREPSPPLSLSPDTPDIAALQAEKERLARAVETQEQWLTAHKPMIDKLETMTADERKLLLQAEDLHMMVAQTEEQLVHLRQETRVLKSLIESQTREKERVAQTLATLTAALEEKEKLKAIAMQRTDEVVKALKKKRIELKKLTEQVDQQAEQIKAAAEAKKSRLKNVDGVDDTEEIKINVI